MTTNVVLGVSHVPQYHAAHELLVSRWFRSRPAIARMAEGSRGRNGRAAGGTRQHTHGKTARKKLSSLPEPLGEDAFPIRPPLQTPRIPWPACQRRIEP